VWLGQQKLFQEQKTKAQQCVISRQLFRDLTSAEIEELVEIARMGITTADIEKMRKKKQKDVTE
jgi:predicted DNA-binding protein YlxM (UPF0122 family)